VSERDAMIDLEDDSDDLSSVSLGAVHKKDKQTYGALPHAPYTPSGIFLISRKGNVFKQIEIEGDSIKDKASLLSSVSNLANTILGTVSLLKYL
jgi:hypothetical protein